jgi:hypothetical protein
LVFISVSNIAFFLFIVQGDKGDQGTLGPQGDPGLPVSTIIQVHVFCYIYCS